MLELGVSYDTIDSIEIARKGNPDHCYRDGLKEWLIGGERTWGDLVEAMSSPTVGHSDIAMVIKRQWAHGKAGNGKRKRTWKTETTFTRSVFCANFWFMTELYTCMCAVVCDKLV